MITQSGEELKLVGRLEVFNDYENSRYLGKVKAVKLASRVASL
jgi:hypothetical protein